MIKCVSFKAKLPIPGGVHTQAGPAHSKEVRKRIQIRRRKAVLQPEVCLPEMSEAHSPCQPSPSRHWALIDTRPQSKASSSRDWSPPGWKLGLGEGEGRAGGWARRYRCHVPSATPRLAPGSVAPAPRPRWPPGRSAARAFCAGCPWARRWRCRHPAPASDAAAGPWSFCNTGQEEKGSPFWGAEEGDALAQRGSSTSPPAPSPAMGTA